MPSHSERSLCDHPPGGRLGRPGVWMFGAARGDLARCAIWRSPRHDRRWRNFAAACTRIRRSWSAPICRSNISLKARTQRQPWHDAGALLSLWRENLWPVLHLKRIARAAWFNPASNLTDWIEEFRPRPGEMVFEHPLPSAYSSTRFAEYMSSMKNIRCAMMGFSLDETILSTAVEGFPPRPSLSGRCGCRGLRPRTGTGR